MPCHRRFNKRQIVDGGWLNPRENKSHATLFTEMRLTRSNLDLQKFPASMQSTTTAREIAITYYILTMRNKPKTSGHHLWRDYPPSRASPTFGLTSERQLPDSHILTLPTALGFGTGG